MIKKPMNEVVEREFAELAAKRKETEAELARIAEGDDGGMVDISDVQDGPRYGSERLERLRQIAQGRLEQIEVDTLELERVTGFQRPKKEGSNT